MNAESNLGEGQMSTWEGLYELDKHWKSDLDFFTDEIRFLKNLVSKYVIRITEKHNFEMVQKLVTRLEELDLRRIEISEILKSQLHDLSALPENRVMEFEETVRSQQGDLDANYTGFVHDFRQLKRDIFLATEEVMGSEKLKHLLNP